MDFWVEEASTYLNAKEQYLVRDDQYLYFRLVDTEGHPDQDFFLHTATVADRNIGQPVFPDNGLFIRTCEQAFTKRGLEYEKLEDRKGRPYLSLAVKGAWRLVLLDEQGQKELSNTLEEIVANCLGEEKSVSKGAGVLREFYDNMGGDGERIYLSDGLWMSADGEVLDDGR